MLVLARKLEETIVVDGPAVIRLVEIRGGTARIGVEAPATTIVLRGELDRRPAASTEALGFSGSEDLTDG